MWGSVLICSCDVCKVCFQRMGLQYGMDGLIMDETVPLRNQARRVESGSLR